MPMKTKIITENIWEEITKEAILNPDKSIVAVAFFSTGATKLLPLTKGSTLIVNASERIVKSGQTNPNELITLLKKGVKIYNYENLHAKMYLIGEKLFIGSSNASNNSANGLKESMLVSTDKSILNEGKRRISELAINSLGLERLKQLKKIYKTPKFIGGFPVSNSKTNIRTNESEIYVCKLVYKNYPKGSDEALENGKQKAKLKIEDSQHELLDFGWKNKIPFKIGDTVIQVIKRDDGDYDVLAPSTIIQIDKWSKNHSFIFVESPKKRAKKLSIISKKHDISILKRRGFKSIEKISGIMNLFS
jgi:hypothetical protein